MGVRGSSEGKGENGARGFEEWPIKSGVGLGIDCLLSAEDSEVSRIKVAFRGQIVSVREGVAGITE